MLYLRAVLLMGSVWLALAPHNSYAASFRDMPVAELAQHSESVLHCRVIDVESSYKTTPHGERIYTRYLLEVEEDWFAADGSSRHRSLWVQGGKVGNTTQTIVGYPQLQLGKRYVLFVENAQSGLPLTGGAQGVYRVLESKTSQPSLASMAAPDYAVSLQTLKTQVQAVAR